MSGRLRTLARASLALGAVLLAVAVAAYAVGVRFNYTESIARGLYLASDFDPATARRGQLVEACPGPEAAEAVADYLPNGDCPGGVIPLGKEIAALPGDRVVVDSLGVAVEGVRLPNSAPLFRDRSGRPLSPRLGEHALGVGEYWLHSGRVRTSIDSRYVGPVSDVRSALRPLLVED
ncbi:S26 family signal peptidase [Rubrivirga sp. S365]|uniref:S26 family signal peptidase n=1 Tax=Rubrivirga sp. S365 TaxID=3076080 RepID=UPI0028C75FC8|nr:S26 family signal peptidase [Rubrivirga sp. S365]MDT7858065.1 S26 family signal peptidase [Rubrivirga sp. S365]